MLLPIRSQKQTQQQKKSVKKTQDPRDPRIGSVERLRSFKFAAESWEEFNNVSNTEMYKIGG